MISQKISLSLVLLILLFLFLIIIILKYYQFCNFFSDCSLTQMEYGGDLGKYKIKYYLNKLTLNDLRVADSPIIILIFYLLKNLLSFDNFLKIYLCTFHAVIFFSSIRFMNEFFFDKFIMFLFIVILYPFFVGYATHIPTQGLGFIFTFIGIFIVRRLYSYLSIFFIILSIFSHYVFLLFHIIFYISKFFSFKFLILIFVFCMLIYSFNINDDWFSFINAYLESLNLFFIPDGGLGRIDSESKIRFVLFTLLPLIFLLFDRFKTYLDNDLLLNNLYKFHLLYSSIIYLFLSEYFYIDRFLSVTWLLYPFYFLVMLRMVKLS
jgi:hypothetical protein